MCVHSNHAAKMGQSMKLTVTSFDGRSAPVESVAMKGVTELKLGFKGKSLVAGLLLASLLGCSLHIAGLDLGQQQIATW